MAFSLVRKKLLSEFRSKVLKWVREERFHERCILAEPPFQLQLNATVRVTPHAGKPLARKARQRTFFQTQAWPEQGVHTTCFPYLGCVLSGEVDWRIGNTQEMARRHPGVLDNYDYHVLTMPAGTFFLMPACVPYSMAGIHWEREHPEQARSKIFWLQILPQGALCHICQTFDGRHEGNATHFLHDAQLSVPCEILQRELQGRSPGYEEVVQAQMLSLLLWVERTLERQMVFDILGNMNDLQNVNAAPVSMVARSQQQAAVVKRACDYIDLNLATPITIDDVAASVQSSRTSINRLFRTELGMTVMQFTTKRRIEVAKSLLATTRLPVFDVGHQVGFSSASYFSQFFLHHVKMTPGRYREDFPMPRDRKDRRAGQQRL